MDAAAARLRLPLASLVSALLVAEAVVVTLAALRHPGARVPLQLGLAADCLLLGGLTLAFISRRRGGLVALGLPWARVLRLSVLATVVFLGGLRIAGVPLDGGLVVVAGVLELVVIGSIVLAVRRGVSLERALAEILPPAVRGVVWTEIHMLRGAVSALVRRPSRRQPAWFTTLERSGSGFILPVVSMLSVVELGAVHAFIATRWPGTVAARAVLAGLTVYGFLWLVGDRRAMRDTGHRIEGEDLVLELGQRFRAELPLRQVKKVIRLRSPDDLRRVQPRGGRNPRATPFDTPNVHLCFREPVLARRYFGLQRQVEHLDLYVDDPDAFTAALAARLTPPAA